MILALIWVQSRQVVVEGLPQIAHSLQHAIRHLIEQNVSLNDCNPRQVIMSNTEYKPDMSRTTRILAFSVPPTVAKEIETLAKRERRTKSELFREMVRVYERYRAQRELDEERWVENLIAEVKAEQSEHPMSVKEMLKESDRIARYGERQAKKLGIKPKDISRLVHEYRRLE